MIGSTTIRDIAERNAKLLALRPDRGHLTGVTTARVEEGLRCSIEEGPWKLAADMPVKAGGTETAPTPGTLGRGADEYLRSIETCRAGEAYRIPGEFVVAAGVKPSS